MARVTPPLGSTGLFSLRLPFLANPTLAYHVGAVQTFEECTTRNFDVMAKVYTPAGLTPADYQTDVEAGAAIVTLLTPTKLPLYVPDTYIDNYPNMGIAPHSWTVASVNLGILPDGYDATRLTQAVQQAVSDYIGVNSVVTIATTPTTDAITQAGAAAAAAARLAAITNRTTPYAQVLTLQAQIVNYQANEATYLQLIVQLQDRIAELEGSAPGS